MKQQQLQDLSTPLVRMDQQPSGQQFKIPLQDLKSLFQADSIREGESARHLYKYGGMQGLERKLKTSLNNGIDGVAEDIKKRIDRYGSNEPILKSPLTLYEIIMQNFEDPTLRILVAAAIVSLVIGILTQGFAKGWIEGASIIFAVLIVVTVGSFNNYVKEQQFQKLNQQVAKKEVAVIRNGKRQLISAYDLVVGDIAVIQTGEVLTVDGLVIEANKIQMDESSITGESHLMEKQDLPVQEAQNSTWDINPFLISGSKVIDGAGYMIVLVVGKNSRVGINQEKLNEQDDSTPLQQKLQVLAEEIGAIGIISATLTFSVLIIHLVFTFFDDDTCIICQATFNEILRAFILAITIIVMAVPEGLPLAVTISLAYSVSKMKDLDNLVRYIQACQTMGGANNICSDKTGTLTKNQMSVAKVFSQNSTFDRLDKRSVSQSTLESLCLGICVNSDACPALDDKNNYVQLGNKTECALLEMSLNLGFDYNRYRIKEDIKFSIPFNSARKKMTTIYKHPKKDKWVLFSKGAPEFLLPHCKYIIRDDGRLETITEDIEELLKSKMSYFSSQALRTLLLCTKTIANPNQINPDKLELLQDDMTIVALVGIKDPLRKGIPQAVQACKGAGIHVRMVTGDNPETAIAIAKDAGILPINYLKPDGDQDTLGRFVVMEGKQFRTLVGGLVKEGEGENEKQKVKNIQVFGKIAKQLKVLARSSPTDKYLLATGLKQLGNVVAMTGDGTNDAPALKKADIGFAMGSGTQVAKQAAGIILLQDDFSSIVVAVKYGRNIFDCIRKFLQFQLTVNIVAISVAFLGAVFINQSPLTAVQMLWVNLIMDTLAALALATDPPQDELLDRMPYARNQKIITPLMWRSIVLNAAFQIIVNTIILFKGDDLFGVPDQIGAFKHHSHEIDRRHFTIFFNIFLFLTIFNFFNARTLKKDEINPFANFCINPMFIVIVFSLFILQVLVVQFGGEVFKLAPLTPGQHAVCILIGSSSLLFNIIYKTLLPQSCINQITFFHNIETRKYDVDRILRKVFNATVPNMKGIRKSVANVRSRKGSAMLYEV